jgi:hypothetical protein
MKESYKYQHYPSEKTWNESAMARELFFGPGHMLPVADDPLFCKWMDGFNGDRRGDYYQGSVVDGIPNGNGQMFYANKTVHDGAWKNGKRDGPGTLWTSPKSKITGTWVKGKLINEYDATFLKFSKGEFSGHISNGNWNGPGTLYFTEAQNGIISIHTEWKNNKPVGQDYRVNYSDGWTYTGPFTNKQRNGKGTMTKDEITVSGTWKDDVECGEMERRNLHDASIATYTANPGKEHVFGCYVSRRPSNSYLCHTVEYTGSMLHDSIAYDGNGVMKLTGEKIVAECSGEWKDGQVCGYAVHTIATNGNPTLKYEGQFEKSAYHGTGKLVAGKLTYEGQFYGGRICGNGKLKDTTGDLDGNFTPVNASTKKFTDYLAHNSVGLDSILEYYRFSGHGTFKANRIEYTGHFVNSQFHGYGDLQVNGQYSYSGNFHDSQRDGDGVTFTKSGDVIHANYARGVIQYNTFTNVNMGGGRHMITEYYTDDFNGIYRGDKKKVVIDLEDGRIMTITHSSHATCHMTLQFYCAGFIECTIPYPMAHIAPPQGLPMYPTFLPAKSVASVTINKTTTTEILRERTELDFHWIGKRIMHSGLREFQRLAAQGNQIAQFDCQVHTVHDYVPHEKYAVAKFVDEVCQSLEGDIGMRRLFGILNA